MGRRISLADDQPHQTLLFPFLLTGMAAAIALSAILCGVRFRKKSSSSNKTTQSQAIENLNFSSLPLESPPPPQTPASATVKLEEIKKETDEGEPKKELPLPPAKQLKETISCNNFLTKSASSGTLGKNMSMRNLGRNMSLKMSRTMSMARRVTEDINRRKGKLKHEDSVWMKTIILGEKCRVPDEDEAEIYDAKGNKISTYHPKTAPSLAMSRNNSLADTTSAIPCQEKQRLTRKLEEEEFS